MVSGWRTTAAACPPELCARLFDSQGQGAISDDGAGLGLSIARGIVKAHGGHLGLERSEQGASFLIMLPVEGSGEGLA